MKNQSPREACVPYGNPPVLLPPNLNAGQFFRRAYKKIVFLLLSLLLCAAAAGIHFYIGGTTKLGRWSLIDVVILLVCGLFIFVFRSRLFALVLAVYALYCPIRMIIGGEAFGLLAIALYVTVLAAAVTGFIGTFRFHEAWRDYRMKSRASVKDAKEGNEGKRKNHPRFPEKREPDFGKENDEDEI